VAGRSATPSNRVSVLMDIQNVDAVYVPARTGRFVIISPIPVSDGVSIVTVVQARHDGSPRSEVRLGVGSSLGIKINDIMTVLEAIRMLGYSPAQGDVDDTEAA